MRHYERNVPGCGDLEKTPHPCVSYRVSWPEATAGKAAEPINRALREALAAGTWEEEARRLEEAFKEFQETKFDNEVTFYVRRIAEVVRSDGAVFSVAILHEQFTGGELPESRRTWLNFEPASGRVVRLTEVLAAGAVVQAARYAADPANAAWCPAAEGLYLLPGGAAEPVLVKWREAAAWFPARSEFVPLH